jgi:hypothetical protein
MLTVVFYFALLNANMLYIIMLSVILLNGIRVNAKYAITSVLKV